MKRFSPALLLAALLLSGWFVHQPGLAGGFLFDDHGNLPHLGAYGPVDDTTTLLRYLTGGSADPTGRPIALASFLLDARNWPADPYPFKRTNLLLHLLNGLLLAWLLTLLGRERGLATARSAWTGVLGAGLWLLHPLFVSTTLYIVQRHAMLPATFTLLGLIGYVWGRHMLLAGYTWRGTLLATSSVGLGTLLATLSKANGALLPLLALALEVTVLRAPPAGSRQHLNIVRCIALLLPVGLLLGYLIHMMPSDWTATPAGRPWTHLERLLTQPRILLDYLGLLWLPRPYTAGLFNDQFAVSTELLRPWITLPAIAAVVVLLTGALLSRRRFPIATAAVLFFLAGHLLESGIIPLELYFEHRNYLPALLMFWPLAWWLTTNGSRRKAKAALAVGLLAMLATMTYMRADLWGDTTEQALLWAKLNPDSPRASAYAAQLEMREGRPDLAEKRLRQSIADHPDDPQLTVNLLGARCQQGNVDERDIELAARSLRNVRTGTGLLFKWFGEAIQKAQKGSCPGLDFRSLERLVEAAWENPDIAGVAGRRQDLLHLEGRLALAQGDSTEALRHFDAALAADPRPAIALRQAALLGTARFSCAGLAHLDRLTAVRDQWAEPEGFDMPAIHYRLLLAQGYWEQEIQHIRLQLLTDLGATDPKGCRTADHHQSGERS